MVTLKGTKEGLLISLGAGDWTELLSELIDKLERPRAAGFFRGAYAIVEPEGWELTDSQSNELARVLEGHGMHLDRRKHASLPVRISARSDRTLAPGQEETENDSISQRQTEDSDESGSRVVASKSLLHSDDEHELWSEAAIVRRTVRSGQSIRYPGHVVVYGDVNPGGEIVAGGDVIVWGNLNGMVHAGATGDETSIVGALQLAAMQLRIGSRIARAPDNRALKAQGAEVARVRNGRIVIENWTPRKDWSQSQDWLQSLISNGKERLFRK